jgi:hypothetical protein
MCNFPVGWIPDSTLCLLTSAWRGEEEEVEQPLAPLTTYAEDKNNCGCRAALMADTLLVTQQNMGKEVCSFSVNSVEHCGYQQPHKRTRTTE